MKIEYTFNELENEAVRFSFNGKSLVSMGGPEETGRPGVFWSPAIDSNGINYDLFWAQSGRFGDCVFYTLQGGETACLEKERKE